MNSKNLGSEKMPAIKQTQTSFIVFLSERDAKMLPNFAINSITAVLVIYKENLNPSKHDKEIQYQRTVSKNSK